MCVKHTVIIMIIICYFTDERHQTGAFKFKMNPAQGTRSYGNQYENINYINTHHLKSNIQREAIPVRPPRLPSDNELQFRSEEPPSKEDCFPSYV